MFELLLLIIVLAIVFFLFFFLRKQNKIKSSPTQKENTPIDELLFLNINIRKKIFNKELIDSIEKIIDKLRDVLPLLNDKYKASELTWVANKMATDYLQKVLNPYMEFSFQTQKEKQEDLLLSLQQIEKELDDTIELVKKNETSLFDTKAKFIKNRFK